MTIELIENKKSPENYWKSKFWFEYRRYGQLAVEKRLTVEKGFILYQLMRGGICDVVELAEIAGVPWSVASQIDMQEVFLWFDDELVKFGPTQCAIPAKNARAYCAECGNRLTSVPCSNRCKVIDYTISKSKVAKSLAKEWCDRGDRHWKGIYQQDLSERQYHGAKFYD